MPIPKTHSESSNYEMDGWSADFYQGYLVSLTYLKTGKPATALKKFQFFSYVGKYLKNYPGTFPPCTDKTDPTKFMCLFQLKLSNLSHAIHSIFLFVWNQLHLKMLSLYVIALKNYTNTDTA